MKSKTFLTFTAIVILTAMVSIIFGFHTGEMTCTIIGYICGIAMAATKTQEQNETLLKEESKSEKTKQELLPVGGIIAIGFVIGVVLGLIFCLFEYSPIAKVFAILGSSLGSVVGCLYKAD